MLLPGTSEDYSYKGIWALKKIHIFGVQQQII